MAPWLQALAHHPVWTLPPPASSSSSNDLARSTAPRSAAHAAAQAALGRSSSTAAPLSQSNSSRSLFGLANPPSSPSSSSSPAKPHPLKRSRSSHLGSKSSIERRIKGGRTTRVAVVRGTDLVVAVGSELRMASLAQVKSRAIEAGESPVEDVDLGDYKVLNTPAVTFEIQQLIVSPTSKLLAVVGAHSVVVVVLPRRGWTNTVSKTLECRSLPVGAFYHSLPGSPAVASVLWHPLGHDASSLVVLTSDATLREYTVSESLDEPAQTLSFARAGAGAGAGAARKGGFGLDAVDRDAQTAVALCIGEGRGDWGPLTLYALMRNGDVVSMCPFLPKKASLTPNYVHALSAFVSTKVDYLSSASPFPALEKRYSLQQQYVSSLVRQVTTSAPPALATDLNLDRADDDDDSHDPSTPRDVVSPSRPALAPRLQGPFLLQPAPAELDNGADGAACDLAYLAHAAPTGESGDGEADEEEMGEGVGVLAIAYRDGKVDLCLEVEKVEARFVGEAPPPAAPAAALASSSRSGALVLRNRSMPRRGGGFGAANLDSDDDDEPADANADDADDAADLPTLAVFESIDLGLATALSPAGSEHVVARALAHNAPVLARDPLHGADTLYVRHALGAHCLFLGPWLAPMAEALRSAARRGEDGGEEGQDDDERLERELRQGVLGVQGGTEVCWVLKTVGAQGEEDAHEGEGAAAAAQPVEGLALLNDVYLGYSLVLVTAALQPVGVELALRIDASATAFDDAPAAAGSATPAKPAAAAVASSTEPAYVSLVSQTPFTVPAILLRPRTAAPLVPRLATTSTELRVTPDTLRQLGKHVSATQTALRDLVAASGVVSARVELQMRELKRQVDKVRELDERRAELGRSVGAGAGAGAGAGDGAAGGVEARVRAAEQRQHALLARTDRVLQRLVESHQPQVSAVERKWFDELERLSDQVDGGVSDDEDRSWSAAVAAAATGGGSGAAPLALRAQRLEAQMELLRPALEELRRKEEVKRAAGTPARNGAGGMGHSQLARVEGLLSDEAKILADAKRKVERLTSALASASLCG
ncbi:hypothetical protein JCM3775_002734 [Rhodotorula graminis]